MFRPPTHANCAQYLKLAANRGHSGRAVPAALLLEHRALGAPCIGLRGLAVNRFFLVYCSSDLYQHWPAHALYHGQFYHILQYQMEVGDQAESNY